MSRINSAATVRIGDEVYTVTTIYFNKPGSFGDNMEVEVFSNEEQAKKYMRTHARDNYVSYQNSNQAATGVEDGQKERDGEEEDEGEGEEEGAENEENVCYDEINKDTFHQDLKNNQTSDAGESSSCYCKDTWILYKLKKVKISDGKRGHRYY